MSHIGSTTPRMLAGHESPPGLLHYLLGHSYNKPLFATTYWGWGGRSKSHESTPTKHRSGSLTFMLASRYWWFTYYDDSLVDVFLLQEFDQHPFPRLPVIHTPSGFYGVLGFMYVLGVPPSWDRTSRRRCSEAKEFQQSKHFFVFFRVSPEKWGSPLDLYPPTQDAIVANEGY